MPGRESAKEPPGASRLAGCCSGGSPNGLCDCCEKGDWVRLSAGEAILRAGDLGLLEEFALKAARAPARVPSLEGWEELSGEWMRKPI